MSDLVILQFLFILSGCSQEFIDPDTDKDKIDIEVDSTYNEYTVTITF